MPTSAIRAQTSSANLFGAETLQPVTGAPRYVLGRMQAGLHRE
jgi:hypothetical protein